MEYPICCRQRENGTLSGPCTWPDTDCYENGPAAMGPRSELYKENMRVLRPDEDVTAVRQQHRNVFAERCRLANIRPPDQDAMRAWWPGTVATFA